jgi:ABC-type bacteriocin/lantibiotic exporter with double-glycine peptidase domain
MLKTAKEFFRQRHSDIENVDFRSVKFILPFLRKYRFKFLIALVLLGLSSLATLPSPLITGHIIDSVFLQKDLSKLNFLVLLLIILVLTAVIFRVIKEYYFIRFHQDFSCSLRTSLYERILRLPLSFFNSFQSGYLVARIDEIDYIANFFSGSFLGLVVNIVKLFAVFYIIIKLNFKLTVISILGLPLLYWTSKRYLMGLRKSSLNAMEKSANIRAKIQESFAGIEHIKSFNKEETETLNVGIQLRQLVKLETFQRALSVMSMETIGLIIELNGIAILWFSGVEITRERLTVGQYVAFAAYLGFIYGPIQLFSASFLGFQKTLMACKRISNFYDKITEEENPKRLNKVSRIAGDISFRNVKHSYEAGKVVLSDITFHIGSKEKIAIVGVSGAGKTTIINLIMGLYEPQAGHILLDGIDLSTLKLDCLRDRIGIVSQNIFLFNDTLLNNIRYSKPEASFDDILRASITSGVHEFIIKLEKGYDSNIGEVGKKLSGGQRQKISIARAILKNPDLVILDEPFANLDGISTRELSKSLSGLVKEKTVILISHSLKCVDWVDKIMVLKDGRLDYFGPPSGLIGLTQDRPELNDLLDLSR